MYFLIVPPTCGSHNCSILAFDLLGVAHRCPHDKVGNLQLKINNAHVPLPTLHFSSSFKEIKWKRNHLGCDIGRLSSLMALRCASLSDVHGTLGIILHFAGGTNEKLVFWRGTPLKREHRVAGSTQDGGSPPRG